MKERIKTIADALREFLVGQGWELDVNGDAHIFDEGWWDESIDIEALSEYVAGRLGDKQ